MGALGGVISEIAAGMMRDAGVDLRTGVAVQTSRATRGTSVGLSDGTVLEVDVVVASLGSIRNVEWLDSAGLAAGQWGLACDAGCRAFDINGVVTDHIFVAGDVARAPHVLYDYEFLSQEHWDNAVSAPGWRPTTCCTSRWAGVRTCRCRRSGRQFGVNIKSVGVCSYGGEIVFTQGSPGDRRFAAYGKRGRIVGAVTFNHGKWLPYYASLIEKSAPFPPPPPGYDRPVRRRGDARAVPGPAGALGQPGRGAHRTRPPTAAPSSAARLRRRTSWTPQPPGPRR
jgi:hypothetical protein